MFSPVGWQKASLWLLWLLAYCCGNLDRSDGLVYKQLPAMSVTLTLKSAFCNMLAAVPQLLLWMWISSISGLHHTFSGYTNTWLVNKYLETSIKQKIKTTGTCVNLLANKALTERFWCNTCFATVLPSENRESPRTTFNQSGNTYFP